MGVDTHMIAGSRACLTFTQTDPHLTTQTTPHYAEALWPVAPRMPTEEHHGHPQ
jgi:hypothetical protein